MADPMNGKVPINDNPFTAVTFRKFVQEQEDIPWLIERLLPAVGSTICVGGAGVGKTTLALQICAALQEGIDIFNRHTTKTKVLYFQFDSLTIEWRAICKRVVPESVGRTVHTAPTYSLDNVGYTASLADLIQNKAKPGFIVWDSLYKLSQRDINSKSAIETFHQLNLLCGDIPYMVLHHPPHNEQRSSGHNSLSGTCSNEWFLAKNKLIIRKGRLVEDKEIAMQRAEKYPGLWYVESVADQVDTSDLDDMILGRKIW